MAVEIQIMIPQYGELNRIYSDFIVNHTFFYGTHALPISICVPVIRSNSRLYLVIRFSSNTFSSIPTLSGL